MESLLRRLPEDLRPAVEKYLLLNPDSLPTLIEALEPFYVDEDPRIAGTGLVQGLSGPE